VGVSQLAYSCNNYFTFGAVTGRTQEVESVCVCTRIMGLHLTKPAKCSAVGLVPCWYAVTFLMKRYTLRFAII
jgi:hypothetical protein